MLSTPSFHRNPVAGNATLRAAPAALLLLLLVPTFAHAQSRPGAGDGFRFSQPVGSVGLHGGWALPRGGSDIFDFTRRELTVGSRDLDGFSLRGELNVRLADRVDLTAGVGYLQGRADSESRGFVGDDGLPIEQITEFSRVPITVGGRLYMAERGRRLSRFAWIPAPWVPYLGAGAGLVRYSFVQSGEFVDEGTLDIFQGRFETDGVGPTGYLAGGAEVSLGVQWLLTLEGRYSWGRAEVREDFEGFQRIDLSGAQATAGFSIRF